MTQSQSQPATRLARGQVLLVAVVLGYLWFVLVNQLRVEWTVNEQYTYGWAVPFLCAYLIWKRISDQPQGAGDSDSLHATRAALPPFRVSSLRLPPPVFYSLFAFLACLWLPVRLVQVANPEWRLVSWALALITVAITLLLLSAFRFQDLNISTCAFPVAFFLVAVPWPTLLEGPLIQTLTRANAMTTTEIVNLLGIPALCHGNVIHVGTGVVGIDDACSGNRSVQASLMVSLFYGELYRLTVLRRVFLCLAGFALSLVFNLLRTTILTTVAARQGVDAIAQWHDAAGVAILVACFVAVWAVSHGLQETNPRQRAAASRPADVADTG